MNSNKKNLVTGLVTALPLLMIVASGIMKLIGAPEVRKALSEANVEQYRLVFGLLELLFAALFVYRRTMKLGLLLLTAYFGGAIATDISYGHSLVAATVILTLVWIAAFLRDRSAFLSEPKGVA